MKQLEMVRESSKTVFLSNGTQMEMCSKPTVKQMDSGKYRYKFTTNYFGRLANRMTFKFFGTGDKFTMNEIIKFPYWTDDTIVKDENGRPFTNASME